MDIANAKGIFVGGASGMCRATAQQFNAKGGTVTILDLSQSNGAEVAKELGGTFLPCNVMDYEATDAAIGEAVDGMGGLHVVVNTAGGGNRSVGGAAQRTLKKDGTRHPTDIFAKVLELNLVASFNINTVAAHYMAKNEANTDGERGVMINTASIAAFEGQIGQVRTERRSQVVAAAFDQHHVQFWIALA